MEIVFLVLSILALYWYLKGSTALKERDLRNQLKVCFTQDEQFKITRKMHEANIEIPNPLPPLLVLEKIPPDEIPNTKERSKKELKNLPGGGTLECSDCNHAAEILGTSHASDFSSFSSGYQCQSCRKFKILNIFPSDKAEEACECGGLLARNHTLVCPVCGSENVNYDIGYLT